MKELQIEGHFSIACDISDQIYFQRHFMKTLVMMTLTVAVSMSSAFSKEKAKDCSLYLSEPRITHVVYGSNNGGNGVNNGVVRILQNNGFTISTSLTKARYIMDTEVRCGQIWTLFGLQDACQTSITFEDTKEEKIVYTDGPTVAKPGLNIDFNSVNFPKCTDL